MTRKRWNKAFPAVIVTVTAIILLTLICFQCYGFDGSTSKPQFANATSLYGNSTQEGRFSDFICNPINLQNAEEIFSRNVQSRGKRIPKIVCGPGQELQLYTCGIPFFKMVYLTPTYLCPQELHVGDWGEGGKWICNCPPILQQSSVVYSFGSDGVIDFESAMNDLFNSRIYTFDPTMLQFQIDSIRQAPFIDFHNIGLTGAADPQIAMQEYGKKGHLAAGAKFMHIEDIMSMLGHKYVDVFKLDCEGCEEEFIPYLKEISSREKPLFGQVLIEFHSIEVKADLTRRLFDILEDLGYRLFHAEANFFDSLNCWELAFVHESATRANH